jgi:disulfide bond formation protein DsbB
MDRFRLGGMALAVVGLLILLISRLSAWELGLVLGIIVILAGFGIYVAGLYRVDKKKS